MNKTFGAFVLGLFLVSFVSATVTFSVQPKPVYNFGDKINATIDFVPTPNFEEVVSVYLKCNLGDSEIYREFLSISEETQKNVVAPVTDSLVGISSGNCFLGVYSGNDSLAISKTFYISNKINLDLTNFGTSFDPGQKINLSGTAMKENGQNLDGSYEANINGNSILGDVKDGEFFVPFTLPSDFSAGAHSINVSVYEKDSSGKVINFGNKIYFLKINQLPTNVEVILDNDTVFPGNSIGGKVVLHDQNGKSISNYDAYIAVKDSSGNIIQKITSKTDEVFNYKVNNSQAPSSFTVSAYAGGLVNSATFEVPEYKKINYEILNDTLVLTNSGNVFYNGTLNVTIGNSVVEVPFSLKVGESQKYAISAPDGSYNVLVGDVNRTLSLSGNAVGVQKISSGNTELSPLVWTVLILLLLIGAYLAFRRERKKRSIARASLPFNAVVGKKLLVGKIKKDISESMQEGNNSSLSSGDLGSLTSGRKAELSLSITGTKQNASIGCLSIKNYPEIKSGEGNVRETLLDIQKVVEGSKGFVYSSGNYLFFIFAPLFTKTFKNEGTATSVAQKIKEILNSHNKKFKKKIEYGISLNYGGIITKLESGTIKFMSLGTLMTSAKKLSNTSEEGIFISDKFKEVFGEKVKGEPVSVGNFKAYRLESVVDKNNHSTFIKGFMARQEKERAKTSEKEKQEKSAPKEELIEGLDLDEEI